MCLCIYAPIGGQHKKQVNKMARKAKYTAPKEIYAILHIPSGALIRNAKNETTIYAYKTEALEAITNKAIHENEYTVISFTDKIIFSIAYATMD